MLVGLGDPDDAAVFRLDAERALIKTTDFFTPIVDDPWLYGAIAATNAMSDVYAMGGDVVVCLNIAGFPEELPMEIVAQIFAGGAAKVREAGAAIAGGHTVTNPEPFYGLSVTGIIHPDQIMRKGGARAGDQLYITKPLGTGVITTAAKLTGSGESRVHRLARRASGKPDLDPVHLAGAIRSMTRLNSNAAQAARAAHVRCATDITGFGLLGHASEMAIASGRDQGVGFRIYAEMAPLLPGAESYVGGGLSDPRQHTKPSPLWGVCTNGERRFRHATHAAVGSRNQWRAAAGCPSGDRGAFPDGLPGGRSGLLADWGGS